MFESRITARASEMLLGCEKSHANTIAWSCDMEGHAKKCVERIVQGMIRTLKSSSEAILAQAMSCSSVRMVFLHHKFPWLCLVQLSTTLFLCFSIALMSLPRMHDDATDKELLARPSW